MAQRKGPKGYKAESVQHASYFFLRFIPVDGDVVSEGEDSANRAIAEIGVSLVTFFGTLPDPRAGVDSTLAGEVVMDGNVGAAGRRGTLLPGVSVFPFM